MQTNLFDKQAVPPSVVHSDPCANKHGGNPESVAAFARADSANRKQQVFELVFGCGVYGMTAQEAADEFGVTINAVSGRFTELKRDKLIHKVGVRKNCGVCVASKFREPALRLGIHEGEGEADG